MKQNESTSTQVIGDAVSIELVDTVPIDLTDVIAAMGTR